MNINKQTLFIIIGAFVLGIVFAISLVSVAIWSYKMGHHDYETKYVKDNNSGKEIAYKTPSYNISEPTASSSLSPTSFPSAIYPSPAATYAPVVTYVSPVPDSPTSIPQINQPVYPTAPVVSQQQQPVNTVKSDVRNRVMNYMYSVDRILKTNSSGTDANQMAQQILSSTLNGDVSGFNSLISSYQNSINQISSLSVPPECSEYHSSCLSVLEQGVVLLKKVKSGIEGQDISSFAGLQGEASGLEDKSRRVDNMAKEIYQKYNIPQP